MNTYLALLVTFLALCGSVSAGNTAQVSAQSLETIELDMPDIGSWNLSTGENIKNTSFAARGNVDFDIYAREDGGDGKMQSGSKAMTNAIKIETTNFLKTLSGADQQIAGTISVGSHSWPMRFFLLLYKQTLTYNDPAGSYSMVITYTGQKHV